MVSACKICNEAVRPIFVAKVLDKYSVEYFQCSTCKFIQTEEPYWLKESYSSAITFLDIGLVSRNISLTNRLDYIIDIAFDPNKKFIDYAGGYGMFTRLMRDKGYDFYSYDLYCENLFAKTFDVTENTNNSNGTYELLTAFEVFEHLDDPIKEIEKMFSYSKSILFSTALQPDAPITNAQDWWYIAAETGQHIAFYTEASLQIIAEKMKVKYYKIDNGLHLFTDKTINIKKIRKIDQSRKWKFLYKKFILRKRKGLLEEDFNKIIGRKVF